MSIETLKAFNRELIALQQKHKCWLKANGQLLAVTEDDDVIYHIGGMYDSLDLHMDLDVLEEQGETIEVWGYGPHCALHPENSRHAQS